MGTDWISNTWPLHTKDHEGSWRGSRWRFLWLPLGLMLRFDMVTSKWKIKKWTSFHEPCFLFVYTDWKANMLLWVDLLYYISIVSRALRRYWLLVAQPICLVMFQANTYQTPVNLHSPTYDKFHHLRMLRRQGFLVIVGVGPPRLLVSITCG